MKTKKRNFSDLSLDLLKVLFLAFAVIICLYPFWNIFIVSINDANDAMRGGLYLLPRKLSLSSYADILGRSTFQHSILVTVARTLIGTPLAVLVTSALAYVLSYRDLVGRKPAERPVHLHHCTRRRHGALLHGAEKPGPAGQLPGLHPANLLSVYNMILVRNYIESMPEALFDAARIDGANDLTIFFRLVLPLSKPIIMTIACLWPSASGIPGLTLFVHNSRASKTMQSILVEILNQYQTSDRRRRPRQTG